MITADPDIIVESVLSGEYWIADGNIMDASDTGDYNHEMHVMDMLSREIGDTLEIPYDEEYPDWDEIRARAYQKYRVDTDAGLITILQDVMPNAEKIINILDGFDDARTYAMAEWGWKRVVDDNVETWDLTPHDREEIADGLAEIAMDQIDPEHEITIYIYNDARTITLPYGELVGEAIGMSPEYDWRRQAANLQAREADVMQQHLAYWPSGVNKFGRQLASPLGDARQPVRAPIYS